MFRRGASYYTIKLLSPVWVREFHKVWYLSGVWQSQIKWLGVSVLENPMDMWVLQEIIYETKPDFIIETGTNAGGSALFFASVLDLLGNNGKVITIDIDDKCEINHPRVTKIIGSSTSEETLKRIGQLVRGQRCMVFLDSAHFKEHVLKEMESYKAFVARGCYMVVADTNINGHPVLPGYSETSGGKIYRGGPMEAVREFLTRNSDFVPDKSREKMLFTLFPDGFLFHKPA
ncbi:MAG: CmcI family methyltransferase [Candidatus Parvarchaeota archaeon]